MDTIKVKLVRSPIGREAKHKNAIKALGLRKIGQVVELKDSAQVRETIKKVDFMVEIVE